jgi:hypothetical protein
MASHDKTDDKPLLSQVAETIGSTLGSIAAKASQLPAAVADALPEGSLKRQAKKATRKSRPAKAKGAKRSVKAKVKTKAKKAVKTVKAKVRGAKARVRRSAKKVVGGRGRRKR